MVTVTATIEWMTLMVITMSRMMIALLMVKAYCKISPSHYRLTGLGLRKRRSRFLLQKVWEKGNSNAKNKYNVSVKRGLCVLPMMKTEFSGGVLKGMALEGGSVF